MEKNREYISVSAFAKQLSLSRQYVYKLMTGRLQSYVIIENGKKMLSVDALEAMKDQESNMAAEEPGVKPDRETVLLQQLLDEKDLRIEDLQKQLEESNRQIVVLQQLLVAKEAQRQLEAPKRKGIFARIFGDKES